MRPGADVALEPVPQRYPRSVNVANNQDFFWGVDGEGGRAAGVVGPIDSPGRARVSKPARPTPEGREGLPGGIEAEVPIDRTSMAELL
jgi:hypothetical protein